jgi:hypothetical protein
LSRSLADTGIAPDAALKSLLGLAVTGEASDRIAAARTLEFVLDTDPTVRDRVPPPLAKHATLMIQLADTGSILPEKIIEAGDGLIRDLSPDIDKNQPDPGLILLASGQTDAAVQTDGQEDVESEAAPEVVSDTALRQFRPDGRLRPGPNETEEVAIAHEENVDRIGDESTTTDQPRRSGGFRETLNEAAEPAITREDNIDRDTDESKSPARRRRSGRFREGLDSTEVSARDRDNVIHPKPAGDEVFIDDDELSPGFTDDELLTEEEMGQLGIAPNRPHRTEKGPDSRILAEMSPKELEDFRDMLDESIEENTEKFRDKIDEVLALQRRELPIRQDLDKIGEKLDRHFGKGIAEAITKRVLNGALTLNDLLFILETVPDLIKFEVRTNDLKIAQGKTMKIRKGEGKEIGADELMEKLKDRWIRKREVEAELENRKSEEHR